MSKKLIIIAFLILLAVLFLSCHENQRSIDLVKQNLYEGRVVAVAVQVADSTNVERGNPALGAAAGSTIGYLLFGSVGAVAGASIGAESEDYQKILSKRILEMVLITESDSGDTSYFSVLVSEKYNPYTDYAFSKKSTPSYFQLMLMLRPNQRIRIPTRAPLSKTAKVYSEFIYLGDEKIPYIDYDPRSN